MTNNQIMIFMLTNKREQMKSRYYYLKDHMRSQELRAATDVYLANCDFITKWLKYYRDKERAEKAYQLKEKTK